MNKKIRKAGKLLLVAGIATTTVGSHMRNVIAYDHSEVKVDINQCEYPSNVPKRNIC